MTNEQTRASIGAEVRRGAEALESADILLNAGKYADAVSRAYYAAYHYARALLLSAGEEPRTHGGLDRLLQRDFVRTGQLEAKDARLLARLMAFRQSADYTAEYVFTDATARDEVDAAKTFVAAALALLAREGWWNAE